MLSNLLIANLQYIAVPVFSTELVCMGISSLTARHPDCWRSFIDKTGLSQQMQNQSPCKAAVARAGFCQCYWAPVQGERVQAVLLHWRELGVTTVFL